MDTSDDNAHLGHPSSRQQLLSPVDAGSVLTMHLVNPEEKQRRLFGTAQETDVKIVAAMNQ